MLHHTYSILACFRQKNAKLQQEIKATQTQKHYQIRINSVKSFSSNDTKAMKTAIRFRSLFLRIIVLLQNS